MCYLLSLNQLHRHPLKQHALPDQMKAELQPSTFTSPESAVSDPHIAVDVSVQSKEVQVDTNL